MPEAFFHLRFNLFLPAVTFTAFIFATFGVETLFGFVGLAGDALFASAGKDLVMEKQPAIRL